MKLINVTLLSLFLFLFSCNQKNKNISNKKSDIISEQFIEKLNEKEKMGEHDNLHYISNYLEEEIDTINIHYSYNLCLCPKWYIRETNEPIWLESLRDNRYSNYSKEKLNSKEITVLGYFYKYKAVPLDLYDFDYLSEKYIPNARIFKIVKELDKTVKQ